MVSRAAFQSNPLCGEPGSGGSAFRQRGVGFVDR